MLASRYARNAGAMFSLKYRRSVLTPPVDDRLKALLAEIADEHGMTIHATEVMPDHVHLVIEADPTFCVAERVNRLKRRTSHLLREECPALRSRLLTLWSRSYFATSVGAVSDDTVRRYIAARKGV
jgi:putative transposase